MLGSIIRQKYEYWLANWAQLNNVKLTVSLMGFVEDVLFEILLLFHGGVELEIIVLKLQRYHIL